MSLAALFSLISAAILGLLPVLLLFGRRRMQRRERPTDGRDRQTDPAARATGREDAQSGERPIMDRLARDRRNERELREAAIIAGAWPMEVRTTGASPAAASPADARADRGNAAPAPPHADRRRVPSRRRRPSLEQRLARLTPLQRAIVYGEILGPPAALRRPGHDDHRA